MKKIRLSENDLIRVIERVIKEGSNKNHKVARPKRRNLKEEEGEYVDVSMLYTEDSLKVSEKIEIYVLEPYSSGFTYPDSISPDQGEFEFVVQVNGGILCVKDDEFFIIGEDNFDYLSRA